MSTDISLRRYRVIKFTVTFFSITVSCVTCRMSFFESQKSTFPFSRLPFPSLRYISKLTVQVKILQNFRSAPKLVQKWRQERRTCTN